MKERQRCRQTESLSLSLSLSLSISLCFPLRPTHTHTHSHKCTHIQWARWRCWLEEQLPGLDRSAVYLNRSVRIMGSKTNMIATWPSDKKPHYYCPVSTHRNTHIWRYSTHTYLSVHTHSYKLTVIALSIKRQTVGTQVHTRIHTHIYTLTHTDRQTYTPTPLYNLGNLYVEAGEDR